MEYEIKEVSVRPNKEEESIRDALRLHRFLLEQLGNELNLMVNVVMAMDGRFDDIRDEMECRFQEQEYKFEVAFDELSALRKRRRIIRG
ncbi:MAG: hypothetical protein P4L67_03900 [Candidatus Pacebacteria bacterium]|nr:hypothetical protein [Candidatus Paceibacterota bacterium]